MKFLLKTPYPCLIKTMNEFSELCENDSLEICDETIIFVYPQNKKQIPFYINLNNQIENEKFSFIKQEDQTIIVLEQEKTSTFYQKEKLDFKNKSCKIEISSSQLSFETDTKKIVIEKPQEKKGKIFKLKDFACVQFKNDLYAFNVNSQKLSHFSADEFVFDGSHLKTNKLFNDSLNRQKSTEYEFKEDICMLSENFTHSPDFKTDLLPYRLMESVKSKDFNYAYDCLSNNLKEKIDKENLKNFFGNFSTFMPLSTTEFLTISNNEKNYVKIDVYQDKVLDISIDKL